jgi:hypothetical protein
MRAFLTVAAFLLLASCTTVQPRPAGHQAAEEAEILAAMDDYMHEISANDLAAMEARARPLKA